MQTIFPAVGQWARAEREWDDLVAELRRHLPERLCNDLIYRAMSLAQQANQAFVGPLMQRFEAVERASRTPGVYTGAGGPRPQCNGSKGARKSAAQSLRTRLVLMNPAVVARELAPGLTPPDLSEYNRIVADLARAMPHPAIAQRYAMPPQALQALADLVAAAGQPVAQALSEHAQNLKMHADLAERLRAQPLLQKGARLLGKAVVTALEPLVGRGTAAELVGFDQTLDRSLAQVEMGWNFFRRECMEFPAERQRRHQLIYLSLVGGLFLRVRKDLLRLGCDLAVDAKGNCQVVPTADRQERVRQHFRKEEPPVREALDAGHYEEAGERASRLVSQVVTDPVVARTDLNGRSVGYRAYALHLSALLAQARERWDAGHPEVAAAIWKQVFQSYPCLVADADLHPAAGERLPLVTAGFRLAAYAEWLRQSNRAPEADQLLLAQIEFVERWRDRTPDGGGLPGEGLSAEMVDWAAALAAYLRQAAEEPEKLDLPPRHLPMTRYPGVMRQYRQAVGESVEVSPLDRYLRGRVNLTRGAAAAAATGGVGLVAGLLWLLLL